MTGSRSTGPWVTSPGDDDSAHGNAVTLDGRCLPVSNSLEQHSTVVRHAIPFDVEQGISSTESSTN